MNFCESCGQEIEDGENLCEACREKQQEGESYLDSLLNSVTSETADESEEGDDTPESLDDMEAHELAQLAEEEETPLAEPRLPVDEEVLKEKMDNNEDISELLDFLSDHYDEEEEAKEEMTNSIGMEEVFGDALSAIDYEGDEDETPFAMEEEPVEEPALIEEPVEEPALMEESVEEPALMEESVEEPAASPMDESLSSDDDLLALMDELTQDNDQESELPDLSDDLLASPAEEEPMEDMDTGLLPDIPVMDETPLTSDEEKKSLRQKLFGNIVDDAEIKKEEKEKKREAELAEKQEEDKKKTAEQKQQEKEERELKKQEDKERKEAEKQAKEAEKARKKEEKLAKKEAARLAAENEVVGRINPVGATIVAIFFGVICLSSILGMKVSSHSNYVATAKKEMGNKRYVEAYKSLNGLTLSDEETVVYKKARLLAAIDQQLQSCDTYIEMNRTTEALNSLIIGVKKYNKHLSEAETLEITGEYNSLRKEISDKLNDEFALSYSQADSLAQMTDRKQYTQLVETYANRDDNK